MSKFKSQLKQNVNKIIVKQLQKQCGTFPIAKMLKNSGVELPQALKMLVG